ncbi:MAG: hypothetical protein AAFQ23_10905, partial [Cyanobacteria bacterium J06623_1]
REEAALSVNRVFNSLFQSIKEHKLSPAIAQIIEHPGIVKTLCQKLLMLWNKELKTLFTDRAASSRQTDIYHKTISSKL